MIRSGQYISPSPTAVAPAHTSRLTPTALNSFSERLTQSSSQSSHCASFGVAWLTQAVSTACARVSGLALGCPELCCRLHVIIPSTKRCLHRLGLLQEQGHALGEVAQCTVPHLASSLHRQDVQVSSRHSQLRAYPLRGALLSFGSLRGVVTSVGDHGALATQPSDSGRPAWRSTLAWPLACGRAR